MKKGMKIDSRSDAKALVTYLLNMAEGQIHYGEYIDIDDITYLLGAAKTIARMYDLKEYIEVEHSVNRIRGELKEATERSLTSLNWV